MHMMNNRTPTLSPRSQSAGGHGIPQPRYRAFQVLHGLGNERLTVEGSHPTVDVWVVRKAEASQSS